MAKNSRSRSRERKAERKKQKQRQRMTRGAILVTVLAVVAAAVFIMVNQPADAPIPAYAFERYEGIPQGKTNEGFPILGKPDAPVSVVEYSNFSCSGCLRFHEESADIFVDLIRQGIISYTFVPITVTSNQPANPEGAAKAALCAGEQGAFFEYHDALFNWHSNFGNQAFSHNRLSSGVENLSLNSGQYNDCIGSSATQRILDDAYSSFIDAGAEATPTILINGGRQDTTSMEAIQTVIMEQLAASEIEPVPLDSEDNQGDEVEATEAVDMDEVEATEEADMGTDESDTEATEEADMEASEVEATEEATEEAGN